MGLIVTPTLKTYDYFTIVYKKMKGLSPTLLESRKIL